MIRLALRTLYFHKGGFIASFIAIFFGATIVIGCGGLLETGVHNAAPPVRLVTAPIVVAGDQRYHGTVPDLVYPERVRLDAGLVDTLASVPGVSGTATDVSFPVSLVRNGSENVALTGHGWSSAQLTPFRIATGVPPSGPRDVVLGSQAAGRAGLDLGESVELWSGGVARTYEISGLATGVGDGSVIFHSDPEADRIYGHPGQVDSIGVFVEPGADRDHVANLITTAVERLDERVAVSVGDDRGQAEDPGVIAEGGDLIPLAAAFGGLSALAAVFVVAGTLGLSIQQRQREMALLRLIGTSPSQLRRLILGETVIVAAVATGLACLVGPRFGEWLLDTFAGAGVVPDAIAFRAGSVPVIVGAGIAIGTAVIAAFIAARAATGTRPTEALAEASLQRRWFSPVRLVAGVLFLGGGVSLAIATATVDGPDASSVATPALLVWMVAFGLLGPVLSRLILIGLRPPMRRILGLAGHLATRNAEVRTAHLVAACLPVMLASGLATGLIYMQTTQSAGAARAFDESLRADLVVTSEAGGLPLDMVDIIRKQPGVAAASAEISSRGYVEPVELAAPAAPGSEEEAAAPQPTELPLIGVTPAGLTRTTAFRASSGSLDALRGTSIALPKRYASGHRLGDTIAMRLGDGTRIGLTLVAMLDGRRGYETALVPASVLIDHTDVGMVSQILVSASAGTDRGQLISTLSRLAETKPGLRVSGPESLASSFTDQDNTQSSMAYLVLAVVVGYAVIALVNTQVLATKGRRRELGLQRLIGATRRQVLTMMVAEALLVSLTGVLLGSLVAAVTLVPVSVSVLGSALPVGSAWIIATVVAGAVGLTVATTLVSARLVLRDEARGRSAARVTRMTPTEVG